MFPWPQAFSESKVAALLLIRQPYLLSMSDSVMMSCTIEQLPAGSSATGGTAASWNRIKLSKELASAVQDDARRKAIDSAKKRAVSQHVDYETFQAMVSVAHLKPIERDEWYRRPAELHSSPAWKFSADGSLSGNALTLNPSEGNCATEEQLSGLINEPKNAEEFQKRWRSLKGSAEDRLRLFMSIGPEKLLPLFKVEIRPALLGEIFSVLSECWDTDTDRRALGNPSSDGDTTNALEKTMGALSIQRPSALLREEGEANGKRSGNASETDRDTSVAAPQRQELTCAFPGLDDSFRKKKGGGTLQIGMGADAASLASEAADGAFESTSVQESIPAGSPEDAAESQQHVGSVASGESQKTELQGHERRADPQAGDCVEKILNILTALSKSGRFSLTLRLLSNGHKKDMRSVFEKLRVATIKQGAADALDRLSSIEALFLQ
ncbi:hypothetical protein KFL_001470250 [Klebsormidium nitens]|uniref:Uncharacterized protein n=1 Tax=Klebsormidium nitens TaxID=105231 RepID=A0A1Y1I5N5_KLENI|nr:hypothetical protein KFL_001470250 [Klebsormidium nitens]|eukprot:GAQ83428.1 hypothetical protein KFL_001470250 [Klebsormidium nitens]